jgi:hypothetical protein
MHVRLEILIAVVIEEFRLLGYNALYFFEIKPTFRMNMQSTKNKPINLLFSNNAEIRSLSQKTLLKSPALLGRRTQTCIKTCNSQDTVCAA